MINIEQLIAREILDNYSVRRDNYRNRVIVNFVAMTAYGLLTESQKETLQKDVDKLEQVLETE